MNDEELETAVRAVPDPELPDLTLGDLGIVRAVTITRDGEGVHVHALLTPTWSGCPATEVIASDVKRAVEALGATCTTSSVLSPAWSSSEITPEGREKLRQHGIAPPVPNRPAGPATLELGIRCPQCGSVTTRETSPFGSTPCTAIRVCGACLEPFPAFKTT